MRLTTASKDYIRNNGTVSFMTYAQDKSTSTREAMSSSKIVLNNGKTVGQVYESIDEIVKTVRREVKGKGLAKGDINNLTKERLSSKGKEFATLFALRDKIKLSKTSVYEVLMSIDENALVVGLQTYELLNEKNSENVSETLIETVSYDLKGKKSDVNISLEDFYIKLDRKNTDNCVANISKLAEPFDKVLSEINKTIGKGDSFESIVLTHKEIHDREVERADQVLTSYLALKGVKLQKVKSVETV